MSIFNKKIDKQENAAYIMKTQKDSVNKEENIYAIFDSVAGIFNLPFVMSGDGVVRRSFADSVRGSNSNLSRYPEEFLLYRIGSFCASTGCITPHTPVLIARGSDFKITGSQSDHPVVIEKKDQILSERSAITNSAPIQSTNEKGE